MDLDDDWSLFYEDAAPKAVIFIEGSTTGVSSPPLSPSSSSSGGTLSPSGIGKTEITEGEMLCPQHSGQLMEDYCETCKKPICTSKSILRIQSIF